MTSDRISAAIYDPFLWLGERAGMARTRARLLASASGRVLEIGAGTGLNLRHYPDTVDELVLSEPVEAMARRLERRTRRRRIDAHVVRAAADTLPFTDATFDTVVSTLVLCTVEHPGRALAELRRVLRPGGRLLFIEHVRADAPRLARWQDRLERPWCSFAAGCRANRPTVEAIAGAGLTHDRLEHGRWRGMPPIVAPLAIGTATS